MPKIVKDEDIYRATMQVVIERGYSGAATKQIAEAAGVSEVTLFRKYGNKGELIKQAIAAQAKSIDFENAAAYTGDVKSDLLRLVTLYQGTADSSGQFFSTMLTEIPRHPELNDLLELPVSMFSGIGKMLARYQADGILTQEHPLHAVAELLGPLMITNMLRANKINIPIPPIDLNEHVNHFLNGRRLPKKQTADFQI